MKHFILHLSLGFVSLPAWGADDIAQCIDNHNQCVQTCLQQDKIGAKATCVAKCAGVEAQCAGQVGIEQSEPFIREKAQQLEGILKELMDNLLPKSPEQQAPAKPSLPPQET